MAEHSFSLLTDRWFMPLECTGTFHLCTDVDKERLGRLAIKAIHEQMDDDKDGMIEASETSDVSGQKHSDGRMPCSSSLSKKNSSRRPTLFDIIAFKMPMCKSRSTIFGTSGKAAPVGGASSRFETRRVLFFFLLRSLQLESTDDVIKWIVDFVHLPMYVENFRRNQIDGRIIPRWEKRGEGRKQFSRRSNI